MSELTLRRAAVKGAIITPLAFVRGSAANSAVTVGLIGAGSRGTYVTGQIAKNTPARVVALCDIVDGKGEKPQRVSGSRIRGSTRTTINCSQATLMLS